MQRLIAALYLAFMAVLYFVLEKSEAKSKKTILPVSTKPKDEPEDEPVLILDLNENNSESSVEQYTLRLPLEEGELSFNLSFARQDKKEYWHGKRNLYGMKGFCYSYNGRTYCDVESLRNESVEILSDDVQITRDIYGEKVLKKYTEIPTFDSGDREWDSEKIEFLMFDGKNVNMIIMRGGYSIASLTFYTKLLAADAQMKALFEKLGWPTDGIEWI